MGFYYLRDKFSPMRFFLITLLLHSLVIAQPVNKEKVWSPDRSIELSFWVSAGKPHYSVCFQNQVLLGSSGLGLQFSNQPAVGYNMEITEVKQSAFNEVWTPVWGSSSQIRNEYHLAVFCLKENQQPYRQLHIEFRVYNDGVAFRYVFPDAQSDSLLIISENSEFRFARNDSVWWIPSDEFAYESLYRHTTLSDVHDANTPFTVVTPQYCISIHEAALLDYSEMVLQQDSSDSLCFRSRLWPWPDGVCVRAKAPFHSPWRSIMITRTPGELMQSHLIQNLNEPCAISDISWIKPVQFVGIWWGMHTGLYTWHAGPKHGATTRRTKQYIDFAASNNIGGVLAEGWNRGWETWAYDVVPRQDFCKAYPDFNLKKVVAYAQKNQVEFISHHETGGNIPEYERQLDSAMKLCYDNGIHYLKTGYAGPILPQGMHHHGQYMVRHFQHVVETAAKYHINLDVHESIKPTGLDRTWPNLMTQEAVRGNEWNATYRATPPYHSTILPFTRLLAGPADNTPGIFHINYNPAANKRLYCTQTHQAAMYIVNYSPMVMFADLPENYEHDMMFSFLTEIPLSWDETTVPLADPGNYVCVARRSDSLWYVGALADENCYLLKIPMTFLSDSIDYTAEITFDSDITDWELNPDIHCFTFCRLNKSDTLFLALSKAGGFIMKIEPYHYAPNEPSRLPVRSFNSMATRLMMRFEAQKTYGNNHVAHAAVGAKVTQLQPYSGKYPASGNNAVCDGITGSFNFSDGSWQGYEGNGMEAIVELPSETSIGTVSATFLYSPNDWIFMPSSVDVYISADGVQYTLVQHQDIPDQRPADEKIMDIRSVIARFETTKVRFIKVVAASTGTCPEWHYARGQKSWIFIDEIVVTE